MRALSGIVLVLVLLAAAPAFAELPHFDARAPTWKTLVVLAVPEDLWNETLQAPDPGKVGGWYSDHGREWFQTVLASELREYLLRVTYGTVPLDIEVTPFLRLPRARTEAAPFAYVGDRSLEARDALREARRTYALEDYRAIIVLDPTSPAGDRFGGEWGATWGKFYPSVEPGVNAIIAGTFTEGTASEPRPEVATARILAHEVLHAVDFARDGRHDILDNTGTNYCLHGPSRGGEPWLCPFNEAPVLGVGPRTVGPGDYAVKPVEEGPGNGLAVPSGAGRVFIEHRTTANPKVVGEEGPALLVWRVTDGTADLMDVLREPGRSLRAGVAVEVLSISAAGAEVRLG